MELKKIIGIITENDSVVSELLKNDYFKQYHVSSINSIVESFSKFLPKDESLYNIRKRGYIVNKRMWVSLLLSSIPKDKNFILIKDLSEEDCCGNFIHIYRVNKNNVFEIVEQIIKDNV